MKARFAGIARGSFVVGLCVACVMGVACKGKSPSAPDAEPKGKTMTVHVAPDGLDSNPGTKQQPLASLAAARDAIRKMAGDGDKRIVVHGGAYWDVSLTLGPEDSGLTIEAAQGESPVLYGGKRVTDWHKDGEKFYAAKLPGVSEGKRDFRTLIVADEFAPRARLPERGQFEHETVFDVPWDSATLTHPRQPTDEERVTMQYREGDLGPWLDANNAEFSIFHVCLESLLKVRHIDHDTRTVTFSSPAFYAIGTQWGERWNEYIVWNVREGMHSPGQWYLDRTGGRVVYWPREGQDMSELEVIAPTRSNILRIEGRQDAPVRDVTVRGLTFACTSGPSGAADWGGNSLPGAVDIAGYGQDITLSELTFRLVGGMGIRGGDGPGTEQQLARVRVSASRFEECGGPAVMLWSQESSITDCVVRGVGRVYPGANGLGLRGLHFEISHNDVSDCPAIAIYGSGGYDSAGRDGQQMGGPGLIANNVIRKYMMQLNDGAAVYGFGTGIVIRGNATYGSSGRRLAHAYYLDEYSKNCVIEKNLAVNTGHPLHEHIASDFIIRDNVFVDSGTCKITFPKCSGFVMERNVIVADGDIIIHTPPEGLSSMPRNIFFSRYGQATVGWLTSTSYGPVRTEALQMRDGSVSEDPMFVAADGGDYSFRDNSPAHGLGIKPIEAGNVGPRERLAKK